MRPAVLASSPALGSSSQHFTCSSSPPLLSRRAAVEAARPRPSTRASPLWDRAHSPSCPNFGSWTSQSSFSGSTLAVCSSPPSLGAPLFSDSGLPLLAMMRPSCSPPCLSISPVNYPLMPVNPQSCEYTPHYLFLFYCIILPTVTFYQRRSFWNSRGLPPISLIPLSVFHYL